MLIVIGAAMIILESGHSDGTRHMDENAEWKD
jgi:hypothetical protein